MSLLEIPGVLLASVPNVTAWPLYSRSLWVARVLAGGLAFLLSTLLIGRICEGLQPGYGAAALTAYALGMLVAPLAATSFEHVTAGAVGLSAFALAWARRPALAGLVAGASILVAYEAALIVVALAVYVTLQSRHALLAYTLALSPALAALLAYNQLAFGAPWHFSYNYVGGQFAAQQAQGFFGLHLPSAHSLHLVLTGPRGLLLVSPIMLAAAYGLVLLARDHLAEAIVCASISFAFFLLDSGYFDPIGGLSPGPRFLVPSLPFLALGLAPAFARRFRLTATLTLVSVIATTATTLTWPNLMPGAETIWGTLIRIPTSNGSTELQHALVPNVLSSARLAALLVALSAAAALLVSLSAHRRRSPPAHPS